MGELATDLREIVRDERKTTTEDDGPRFGCTTTAPVIMYSPGFATINLAEPEEADNGSPVSTDVCLSGLVGIGPIDARRRAWNCARCRQSSGKTNSADVQLRLLELAARQESARRATFAAVKSQAQLAELQRSLRTKFLGLIGGLPENTGAPPVKITGQIEAEDYMIEKLVFESFPG